MKNEIIISVLLFASQCIAQTNLVNPYASIGEKAKVLTLSNGRYTEFFDNDTLQRIGSVMFNTVTNKIAYLLSEKNVADQEPLHRPTEVSRFLSVDPATKNFPELTPYQHASNTPIQAIDLDGLEAFKILTGTIDYYDQKTGERKVYTNKKLILTDINAPFKVVDENDVELSNFKYCDFTNQMQGFRLESQIPGGDGKTRLTTPNIKRGLPFNTESSFAIETEDFSVAGFKADKNFSMNFGQGVLADQESLYDNISNSVTKIVQDQMQMTGQDSYNIGTGVQKFDIVKINNGTDFTKDQIIEQLKASGAYHDKLDIQYSESKGSEGKGDGTLSIEFGTNECK